MTRCWSLVPCVLSVVIGRIRWRSWVRGDGEEGRCDWSTFAGIEALLDPTVYLICGGAIPSTLPRASTLLLQSGNHTLSSVVLLIPTVKTSLLLVSLDHNLVCTLSRCSFNACLDCPDSLH